MVQINHKNKLIDIDVKRVSAVGKYTGLMFKTRNTENLLFDIGRDNFSIHSCFVFFPFLALWLDEENKVLRAEVVKPWRLRVPAEKGTRKLIEIPLNNENRQVIGFVVGKERFK